MMASKGFVSAPCIGLSGSHGIVCSLLLPRLAAKVKSSVLSGYDVDELLKQLDSYKAELADVSAAKPCKRGIDLHAGSVDSHRGRFQPDIDFRRVWACLINVNCVVVCV
jgi:hypothetical protein